MGAIFNDPGGYHGFEINNSGVLVERWGVPPVNLTTPTRNDGTQAVGFKPNTPVSVRRLTNNKGEVIFPGAFFVEALSASGDDTIIWVWTTKGWEGPYGG